MATNEESSKIIFQGSLYTVEERLKTFDGAHWPYDSGSCTPLKMAEAGFYFCGTESTPDWVRCIVCHHELDGWEEMDDPREEHRRHKPNCPFVKKIKDPYKITVGEVLELEKEAIKFFVKLESEKLRESSYRYCEELQVALTEAMEKMTN